MKEANVLKKLNISGKFTKIFINSKMTGLIIFTSLVIGFLSVLLTARTYNPQVIVPVVQIKVNRPSSDTHEIYHQIIKPLEGLIHAIPEVRHSYGMAASGQGVISVRFKIHESEELCLVRVYNQINSNLDKLPPGTALPLIQSISLFDVPIVTFTLYSNQSTQQELRHYANILLEKIRNVPNVGKIWVLGSSTTAVKILLNPTALHHYQIPIQTIKQILRQNYIPIDAGQIEKINRNYPIRINGEVTHPDELKNTLVGVYQGKPIYLKDVAEVKLGMINPDIQSYYVDKTHQKRQQSITIAIAAQKSSNNIKISNSLLNKVEEIQKLKLIPKHLHIATTRDYGKQAHHTINTLLEHMGITIVCIIFLLVVFLGWKESTIVIVCIPMILGLILGFNWMIGESINRVTLFAFIISLGLL